MPSSWLGWRSLSTRRAVKGDAAASATAAERTVIEPGGVVLRKGGDSDNASRTSSAARYQARGCPPTQSAIDFEGG